MRTESAVRGSMIFSAANEFTRSTIAATSCDSAMRNVTHSALTGHPPGARSPVRARRGPPRAAAGSGWCSRRRRRAASRRRARADTIVEAGSMTSTPHMNPAPRTARMRPVRSGHRAQRLAHPLAIACARARASPDRSGDRAHEARPATRTGRRRMSCRDRRASSRPRSPPSRASRPSGVRPPSASRASADRARSPPARARRASRCGRSPHWISSRISAMPCAAVSSRSACRNSGSSTRTPPSPCTGSAITAATRLRLQRALELLRGRARRSTRRRRADGTARDTRAGRSRRACANSRP